MEGFVPIGKKSGAAKSATVLIAASDSTLAAKAAAHVICDGSADQVQINQAINDLPAGGGEIRLAAGTYNISAPIIVDRSYVTIEGEGLPFWGAYRGPWNGNYIPVNSVGNNSTRILASARGFNIIEIQNNNIPDNTENRHRAIRIKDLYLCGLDNGTTTYSGTGIKCTAANVQHDICSIESVFCGRLQKGIDVSFDAGVIQNCNVQDCSGDCITYFGTLGRIVNNIVYDCGGSGIKVLSAVGTVVANNVIGNLNIGVELNGAETPSVTGNTFRGSFTKITGAQGGIGILVTSSTYEATIVGNTFLYSLGTYPGADAAHGIYIQGNSRCNIVGNTFRTTYTTSGYAIYLFQGQMQVEGNLFDGPWNSGRPGRIFADTLYPSFYTISRTNRGTVVNERGPCETTSTKCLAWFRADTMGLADNAAVTEWHDSTMGLWRMVPHTTSPTFRTNVINGLPVVRFNGTNNALRIAAFEAMSKITVFMVANKTTTSGIATFFNVGNNFSIFANGSTINLFTGGGSLSGPSITLTNFNIIEVAVSTNGASSSVLAVNGTAGTPGTTSTTFAPTLVIGANGGLNGEWLAGDIAEVLIYSGNNMSPADRSAIRGYLSSKYALASS